jgi:hypothetical protein
MSFYIARWSIILTKNYFFYRGLSFHDIWYTLNSRGGGGALSFPPVPTSSIWFLLNNLSSPIWKSFEIYTQCQETIKGSLILDFTS